MIASGFSEEFWAGAFIGVAFGVLLGLAFTLSYAMKQFRRFERERHQTEPMWSTSTLRETFRHANDEDGSMGNEDLPGSVIPFDPEQQASI